MWTIEPLETYNIIKHTLYRKRTHQVASLYKIKHIFLNPGAVVVKIALRLNVLIDDLIGHPHLSERLFDLLQLSGRNQYISSLYQGGDLKKINL